MEPTTAATASTPNPDSTLTDSLIDKLKAEKKAGIEFQRRKHPDWNENYELYRNRVRTNRLTQRQAVNIPLMKETIKTALAGIDDVPNVDWSEKSGDEEREIIYQEIWNKQFRDHKLEWVDVLDKKNVLLYGLSTKKLNLTKQGVTIEALDVFDVVYDPQMNPKDIETARFIVNLNIFRPLRDILASKRYTEAGKQSLSEWVTSDRGMVQTSQNAEELRKKNDRLRAMGVNSEQFGNFSGGDMIVNLTEHYTKVWNKDKKAFEKRVIVYAEDNVELLNETLMDLIGIDEWPFELWSEDLETVDVYADSIADLVRTPNKVLNVWFSQMVENRTLRNFGMHWYDSSIQGYQPQTYEPGQGRMLPAPGDPSKTILPVAIDGLDETMNAINFLTSIVERGSGINSINKGTPEGGQQTLGEVQILVGKTQERAISMNKFYRASWYAVCKKWDKIMQANDFEKFTLYKSGSTGKVYEKIVYNSDWKSEAGYEPTVSSTSEQEESSVKSIQKWLFVTKQFPANKALMRIAQKRQLEILDLSPQEMREVEDDQDRVQEPAAAPGMPAMNGAPAAGAPEDPEMAKIAELAGSLS